MTNFPEIKKSTNKINYYQQSLDEIEKIKLTKQRPSLLLHACCAPCAAFPLEFLNNVFNCTILYNNSNIYPSDEYYRRLNELKRYLDEFNQVATNKIKLVEVNYDNELYTKKLEPLKDYPEGSIRCFTCYSLRMEEAYNYASNNHFDYFTTVMTISRQKDSQKLNEIGSKLQSHYPTVKYFYSDFKKKKGIDRARELSKQHNLYRQQYCGCIYSYQKYIEKKV
ncbi:epoxyqueuosine reductase QueH [Anaerorhabdus sp.]|jgi:epoxyqueuosine reductase|uniref:epoxyqueuosine reductase QueH n=1 Tax=Anaerorhabdus sp. TaxID=1872524 RepID=UPI002FCC6366